MDADRAREAQPVDPIEDASLSGQCLTEVLHATIALYLDEDLDSPRLAEISDRRAAIRERIVAIEAQSVAHAVQTARQEAVGAFRARISAALGSLWSRPSAQTFCGAFSTAW